MADEPPKKISERFAGWKPASDATSSGTGQSDDILRKAIALNPQMKEGSSTDEFIKKMGAMRSKSDAAKNAPAAPVAPQKGLAQAPQAAAPAPATDAKTLVEIIAAIKTWMANEQKRVANEMRLGSEALEQEKVARESSTKQSLTAVVDLLLRVDPNLLSPKTQALLDEEAKFLKQVGFNREMLKQKRERRL